MLWDPRCLERSVGTLNDCKAEQMDMFRYTPLQEILPLSGGIDALQKKKPACRSRSIHLAVEETWLTCLRVDLDSQTVHADSCRATRGFAAQ